MSQNPLEPLSISLGGTACPDGATKGLESGSSYQLSMMEKADFDIFHSVIQATMDQGRKRSNPELVRITTENEGFIEEHSDYLEKEKPLGCTMIINGDYDRFAVWMNPSFVDHRNFRITLAHELTHGYVGVAYQHSAHWRRWFYRVLWHLDRQDLLKIEPDDDPLMHIAFYRGIQYVRNTEHYYRERLLVEEAFEQAEAEHDNVLANLLVRCNA